LIIVGTLTILIIAITIVPSLKIWVRL